MSVSDRTAKLAMTRVAWQIHQKIAHNLLAITHRYERDYQAAMAELREDCASQDEYEQAFVLAMHLAQFNTEHAPETA